VQTDAKQVHQLQGITVKYFGLDTETADPLLLDQGPSWVYGQGEVLVTGIYDVEDQKKTALDGNGGKAVRNMLFSSATTLIGANIGYDLSWLCYEHKIKIKATKCGLIDVAIAESLIDEYQLYSLDALAQKYLGERKGSEDLAVIAAGYGFKGDFRKHLKNLWYGETSNGKDYKDEIREYVLSDADQPCRIWDCQKLILEEQGLMPAFDMNMKMVKITAAMKQHGVRIDYAKWQENCAIAGGAYKDLHEDFVTKYGEVNINSPKQVAALFDRFDVPYKYKLVFKGWAPTDLDPKTGKVRKFRKDEWFAGDEVWDQRQRLKESFPNVRVIKKKIVLMVPKQYAARTALQAQRMGYQVTNNPSVGKFTLNAMKASYPVVADIVEFKQVTNIITKFLGPNFGRFLVQDENDDWRLHGNFDPVGARQTGRLSASKPNLQNIPSKTKLFDGTEKELDLAHMCREVFLPDRGEMFVKLDFSGQENVLQAHFAVGKAGELIRSMYTANPRLDEHQFVGERSGLIEQHGAKAGRKYAKNVRFGIAYGMQSQAMCEQFGWEKDFADELTAAINDAAPWVRETMDAIQNMLLGKGPYRGKQRRYIKTIIGRHIHLREGNDRDAYKFYNFTIQGSASDMMKLALVAFADSDLDGLLALLLTVHDEGGFSVPMTPEGFAAVIILQVFFCNAVKLDIPINADPEAGANWADAEGQIKGKNPGDPHFTESVLKMLERVASKIRAGEASRVASNDDDDDIDFDALGDEDDDEEEEEGEDE
jgi:DNA polymerase I-like protein with 3'-5' exonuclease and polymerase domains